MDKEKGPARGQTQARATKEFFEQPAFIASEPSAQDGLSPGARFAAWAVVRADPSGKQITVVCTCGQVAAVALEALLDGSSRGCGCTATPRAKATPPARRPASPFARDLAELEGVAGRRRHKGAGSS